MTPANEQFYIYIYNKYYKLLFSISYQYVRNTMDCEDIIQEAFNIFFTTKHIFSSEQHIKNWLCRVTTNLSIECFKKKGIICDCNELEKQIGAEKNDYTDLNEAVNKLKEPYKQTIILFYYNNIDTKDIAEIQKTSIKNVKNRLSRARNMLRKELENEHR